MVRGEPDYTDQVPRRLEYEAGHPNVEIIYLGRYWQAIVREDDGQTIITRYHLRQLLDKLETLDAEKPSGGGQDLAADASGWPGTVGRGPRLGWRARL
jgi:hypothetical protein